jgi:NAD-dependent deacetylase
MALSPADEDALARVAGILHPAAHLLFITGAGLSADSGLPTYRGVGGLYGDDRKTRFGCTIEEALSGPMLEFRPDVTWTYLIELERTCRGAVFNRGHAVIAEMERHFERVWTLTQNVDGFHQQAGTRQVIDIHGDLRKLRCTRPGCRHRQRVDTFAHLELPPHCPRCGGVVRPDVVLFGEMLPPGKLNDLIHELEQGFDMIFSVGTSSLFPYIRLPIEVAREVGIATIEINPDETEVSDLVDVKVAAGAAESLDALWTGYLAAQT